MNIYNNTNDTTQTVYNSYNYLVFSNDSRVFNKMAKRIELYNLVKNLVGDIMEVGVFKGGGMALWLKLKNMYEYNTSMKIIGIDYFEPKILLNNLSGHNKKNDEKMF